MRGTLFLASPYSDHCVDIRRVNCLFLKKYLYLFEYIKTYSTCGPNSGSGIRDETSILQCGSSPISSNEQTRNDPICYR